MSDNMKSSGVNHMRDMEAFCKRLRADKSGLPVPEQMLLTDRRLEELTDEELREYFRLTSDSDRMPYLGLSS